MNSKKHLIVTEYIKRKNKIFFSSESEQFLKFLNEFGGAYVLSPLKKTPPGVFIVIDSFSKQEKEIDILSDVKSVYMGLVGKSIEPLGIVNCMVDQMVDFCNFLEKIKPYEQQGLLIINPINTIISNMSKEYILRLSQKTDLPFIPTRKIESLDQLINLSKSKEKMFVKPLISERAHGAFIVKGLSKQKLKNYRNKYLKDNKEAPTSLYEKIMLQQGLIAQPFCDGFSDGELKIGVIDRDITLARRIIPVGKSEIVSVSCGAQRKPYFISNEEKELALRIYDVFNQLYPASFMRIDLVNYNGSLKINEIEAINPSFSVRHKNLFSESLKNVHHSNLFSMLERQYAKKEYGKII